jgi:hypothetical protein
VILGLVPIPEVRSLNPNVLSTQDLPVKARVSEKERKREYETTKEEIPCEEIRSKENIYTR